MSLTVWPEWCVQCREPGDWRQVRRYYYAPTIEDARAMAVACGYSVTLVWLA